MIISLLTAYFSGSENEMRTCSPAGLFILLATSIRTLKVELAASAARDDEGSEEHHRQRSGFSRAHARATIMPFHVSTLIPETCARPGRPTPRAISGRILPRGSDRATAHPFSNADGKLRAAVAGRRGRRTSGQQDEGSHEREVGWRAVRLGIGVGRTVAFNEAAGISRSLIDLQLGQPLDHGALRLGQRYRLIIAGTKHGTIRRLRLRIVGRRGHARAGAIAGLTAATQGGWIGNRDGANRPRCGVGHVRAGENDDREPTSHTGQSHVSR